MMKILSMAVNDEWIAKLDEIIDNLEYKISWVVNESRLFEQLQVTCTDNCFFTLYEII